MYVDRMFWWRLIRLDGSFDSYTKCNQCSEPKAQQLRDVMFLRTAPMGY